MLAIFSLNYIAEETPTMLQYTHGSLNVPTLQNSGNLFVHRLASSSSERNRDIILSNYTSASSLSSNTYWKSPNAVETSGVSSNGLCLPPEMKVTSSFSHRPRSNTKSKAVKGILKNRDTTERDTKIEASTMPPRSSCDQPLDGNTNSNLSCSSAKRVQFNGLPKQTEKSKHIHNSKDEIQRNEKDLRPNSSTGKTKVCEVKRVPYGGVYMFRPENSAHTMHKLQTKHFRVPSTDTVGSNITAFIKKLRLVESAKLKRAEENRRQMEKLEREIEKSTEKLRRPRIKSAMFKSAEIDRPFIERSCHIDNERTKSAVPDVVRKTGEDRTKVSVPSLPKTKFDVKQNDTVPSENLLPSNSFLLSQVNTGYEDKVRRQRAFSAYTRHNSVAPPYLKVWKPNESNLYKGDNDQDTHLPASARRHLNNYCDSRKTTQILGWLHDVKQARSDKPEPKCITPTAFDEEAHKEESGSDLTN